MKMKYGIAQYTPFIQSWLNSCPAVIDYRETAIKSRPVVGTENDAFGKPRLKLGKVQKKTMLEFSYDESVEVPSVPSGVNFSEMMVAERVSNA